MKNWLYKTILAVEAFLGIVAILFVIKSLLDSPLAIVALIVAVAMAIAFYVTRSIQNRLLKKIK